MNNKDMITESLRLEVARHLEEIESLFKDRIKLTLLIHNTGYQKRDAIISNDDMVEIKRRLEGFLDLR